jgi:hypothetical protein
MHMPLPPPMQAPVMQVRPAQQASPVSPHAWQLRAPPGPPAPPAPPPATAHLNPVSQVPATAPPPPQHASLAPPQAVHIAAPPPAPPPPPAGIVHSPPV